MQMKLSEQERVRIGHYVEEVHRAAISNHQERMNRFRRYYRRFRGLMDPPKAGDEDASNYQVPLLKWHVFSKWADLMHGWLGRGAEVAAEPTGPYDQKIVERVSRMVTWRIFTYMKMVKPAAIATFRAVIFGRTHVYIPWDQEYDKTGRIWYDGPKYIPLWPNDFIVPVEDVCSLHEFSWVIHKERLSPQQLLNGERSERYIGIEKDFQNIIQLASQTGTRREPHGNELMEAKDEAEGVTEDSSGSRTGTLTVLHWYGKRRMPTGTGDVAEDAIRGRDLDESEILVHYCLELHRVIGVQDLDALYPQARRKRPFGEIALNEEGSYWTMGLGEMLETEGEELTANHNLGTEAGEFSVAPVIFAAPEAGLNAKNFRYRPGTVITTEHADKVKVVSMSADLSYVVAKEHTMLAMAERVTGQSEQSLGRSSSAPNAPRTASGQVLLAEMGNLRASLDNLFFKSHLEDHLRHIWCLEQQFAPKDLFFRITEDDLPGTEVRNGFGKMTQEDYENEFDFTLKFAESPWAKEALGQKQLQLYQLDLANPLIASNPNALWAVANRVHKALGDDNFADVVPQPSDMDTPKNPQLEWTMILQGDLPEVNPNDNDDLHLKDHERRLSMAENAPPEAMSAMQAHMQAHTVQKNQKALMQQMVSGMADSLASILPQEGGGQAGAPATPKPPAMTQPEGEGGIQGRLQNVMEKM